MINISKDLLRMKPSKKALAREIDRLNAAISKQHVFQEQAEKSMQLSEITAKGWENIASQYKKLVEKYDVEALAEARRLAVLQIFGGYAHNLNEAAEWLATGTWTVTDDADDDQEVAEPESGVRPEFMAEARDHKDELTDAGYAHGYVKGWNTLLDMLQMHWASTLDEVPGDRFEVLRKTFNRTEAM